MVPEGWEKKTFGCVTRIANGQVDPNDEPYLSMPHIGPENVVSNSGQLIKVKNCKELGLISGKYEFDENAIVYSKIRPNLNKVCKPSFKGVCSADMYPIWGVPEQLNSDYLLHYMLGPSFYKVAVAMSMRTGMPKINRNDLNAIKVLLPPLPEQKKIAQILSTWDKAITTTEQLLANSQQQKKALMQQLLTGKKRLLDENGVRFSGSWESFTLSELFTFKRGKGIAKGDISPNGRHRCVLYGELYTRYAEVIESVYSRTDNDQAELSEAGDILIPSSTTTSGIDLANATAILESGVLLGGDINILRPRSKLSSQFMAHVLTHIKRYEIASLAQGITIIHLYGSDLKKLKVWIPRKLDEQIKISQVLSAIDKASLKLEIKLDILKQEKKALMQQLLTGKRRVKVDEEAV